VSGHTPWSEPERKGADDPERALRVAENRRQIDRRYSSLRWRLVRLYGRLTKR
jgi:hypothetical protein